MHIKQITISGFKSYRDATPVGLFSPAHNVVVGRNGSGKSNFFDAVRFVLSDTFSSLRAEERVALLHEGAGASVLSAYVEILFDNSDGRLPSDREEVALRRMIGLKKDEYVLDRKNVTRTEVFNLLESAGFSRSNPYYIVQQGKVAALCAMTDRHRLELLKEVAGTRVYDERREESLKIMDETDHKRQKIADVIKFIESRLEELQSEKEELKAFQKHDKERKALQYTIHVRELEEAKAALEQLDNARGQHHSRGQELQARLVEVRARLNTAEHDFKNLGPELKRASEEREECDKRRRATVDKVAELQVDVTEAEQAAKAARETVTSARMELRDVEKLISRKRNVLQPLEEQLKELKSEEKDAERKVKDLESRLLNLRVKADRTNQFSSVQQRDAHLKKSIREAKKRKTQLASQIASANKDIERLEKAVSRNTAKCAAKEEEKKRLHDEAEAAGSELAGLRRHRDEVHARRQEFWRKESEISAKIKELQNGMGQMEAGKRAVMGANAYRAIHFIMKKAEGDRSLGRKRVYGPLLDLISVDPRYATAADVTAGSSLLNVVVDNDETSARLVKILQQHRAGRITFIPLSRLEVDRRRPPPVSKDAIPLISKVSCNERFDDVVQHVFGRTLVARTVEVAAQLSHQYGVDCITLEGDQVNKRGAMTGGFMDMARCRLEAARTLREARDELYAMQDEAGEIKRASDEIEASLSKILGDLQQRESFHRVAKSKVARFSTDIIQLEKFVQKDEENIPIARERIADAEQSIQSTDSNIEDFEKELAAPMVSGLSPQEEELVEELKEEIESEKSRTSEATRRKRDATKSVASLRTELKDNLEKRQAELKQQIAVVSSEDDVLAEGDDAGEHAQRTLQSKRSALQVAKTDLSELKASLKECETALSNKQRTYNKLQAQIESDRDEESKINKALEDDRQSVSKRYEQRSIEIQKKADAEKNIRELGSLPADFDKYRGFSIMALMKKLKRANGELQKYSHVNKKALDQFIKFTEQREALTRRREELDSGAEAIRQLINSLDDRKDEDIMRTFKGVSKFFSEVFKELVPGGKATLVMLKSSGSRRDQEAEEPERIHYTGVAMKVSFSTTGEAYLLQQLSGGQKSIVALALIFAIQRLDPAPFYLFDEIDANLDATHRQAVANLIRKQANNGTQFITTTFRPEFVNAGDMWYGVTHKKKVSGVQEVGRDVALTFISDEPAR